MKRMMETKAKMRAGFATAMMRVLDTGHGPIPFRLVSQELEALSSCLW